MAPILLWVFKSRQSFLSFPCWHALLIFFLFFLRATFPSQAQTKLWDNTLGGNNVDELKIVSQTSDGGYILGGNSASGANGDKTEASRDSSKNSGYGGDYWVVKLKADGTKAWDKTFGGESNLDFLTSLQPTLDGGYLLGGYSDSGKSGDKSEANRGECNAEFCTFDYWVVKIDANGNKQWDKTYGGDNSDYLIALQQTSDGGYILGGHSESGASGDKTDPSKGWWDFWVIKINASGQKVWDKSFGEGNYDTFNSLVNTTDGGYLLAGTFYSEATIIKIKADGTTSWVKSLGINNLVKLQSTADGGYIVGYTATTFVFTHDYGLLKIKADGTHIWNKTFGGSREDWITTLQQTSDGGFILGGESDSGINGDKTEQVKGPCNDEECDQDFWVIKLKADGTKQWDKTIGGTSYDRLASVQQTRDGGYIIGGSSYSGISGDKSESTKGNDTSFDYWVVKLDNTIRRNQNITFEPVVLNKAVGDPPFTVSAQVSSGLPITFRAVAGPVSVSGNVVTITGSGTVQLQAVQSGNSTYNPAVADQTFIIEERKSIKKLWDKTLGGSKQDGLTAMVATPDGGYLVGGFSNSGKSGDKSSPSKGARDYWIAKVNNQGKKIWDKAYGGSHSDSLTTIITTPDGGFLLGGTSASGKSGDKSQASKGGSDYWIVKIDGTGTKIWDQTYGGNAADILTTVLSMPDGGYLLGGSSASDQSGDKNQASKGKPDFWIVRLDKNGKKVWDKSYGGNASDKLTAMVADPGGNGFLIGGTSASGKNGDKSQASRGFEDYWVLLLDLNGIKLWDKTFGGIKETYQYDECPFENPEDCQFEAGSSILTALIATPDGGFLLGGFSNAAKGGDKTDNNLRISYLQDYWIVKINNKGSKVWDKTFGGIVAEKSTGPGGYYYTGSSVLRTILATPDGNYLLAGTSDSDKGRDKSENTRAGQKYTYPAEGGGYYLFIPAEEDYWIMKIDGEGTKKWDRTIGSRDYDILRAVVPTRDNGYVLAGTSTAANNGGDKTEAARDTTDIFSANKGDYWLVTIKDEAPVITTAWNMRYGGAATDNFTAVIRTADGGYLSGGYSNSGVSGDKSQNSQGNYDYWIVKSDKNGRKLWDKRYGGNGDDYLNTLIQTQDGGYLLGGSSVSGVSGDKTQASRGDRDYWVVKISSTGTKQWDQGFGGNSYDELKNLLQLSTGEYILAGTSNSPAGGDKSQGSQGEQDYWILKISANGSKLWDKRYGGTSDENLEGLALTLDGGFLLGGSSSSGISGDKTQASRGSSDYWLVRVDSKGNKLWDKRFGGSGTDDLMDLGSTGTTTDNFYLAGHSTSGRSGDKSQISQGGKDFWMLKINSQGEKLWDKRFGGNQDEGLRSILLTADGGYLLAGRSESGNSGDRTQSSRGKNDYWLVKTSSTGVMQWDQRFGGYGEDELRAAWQTSDGGYLIGGRSDSGTSGDRTQPSQGGKDYWLVKVAPITANIIAQKDAIIVEEPVAETEFTHLLAYPNPFSQIVTVSFTLPQTQPATVKVYDLQGKEITTLFNSEVKANQPYQVEWKANNESAGLYLLQLQTPTGKSQQYKLLLSK